MSLTLALAAWGCAPTVRAQVWSDSSVGRPAAGADALLTLVTDEDTPLTRTGTGDGETLPDPVPDPLLDALGTDLPCGTVVTRLALASLDTLAEGRREEVETLLSPPRLSTVSTLPLAEGDLALRFDLSVSGKHAVSRRDVDRDGVPDAAGAVAADVAFALDRLREWTGAELPPGPPLPVYLAESAFARGWLVDGLERHVVVPSRAGGVDRLAALSHQLAHVLLNAAAPGAPIDWEEAAATWLGERVVGEAIGRPLDPLAFVRRDPVSGRLVPPRRSLFSPALADWAGDAGFLAFVDARLPLPGGWLADTWAILAQSLDDERAAGRSPDPPALRRLAVDALDEALATAGLDLESAVAAHHGWIVEEQLLRPAEVLAADARLEDHPSVVAGDGADLPPFGQRRFAVAVPRQGGLRLHFESDGRAEAEAFVLLEDGTLLRQPVDGGARGDGDLRLPAASVVELVVLVQAPAAPADWSPWMAPVADDLPVPGEYRLAVDEDPRYPFELDAIGAEPEASQVRLDWSTTSEEDLVAWHVERSPLAGGPWRRVTGVPFPPSSRPDAAWSYSFVDGTVRPETWYHYRLVAVTSAGFVRRSPSVAVVTLPEGPAETGREGVEGRPVRVRDRPSEPR